MSTRDCGSITSPSAIHPTSINSQPEEVQDQWNGRIVTHPKNPTQHHLSRNQSLKRPPPQLVDLTQPTACALRRPVKKSRSEMQVAFVYGTDDHIDTYTRCIDAAESHIIIASWNLNFIPHKIFSSLMNAKRRGVSISFVVQSVTREKTLNYFYDDEERSSSYTFYLAKTKSHAKFLFVDSKILVLGSYNALGDAYEESLDASIMLRGIEKQLWPFYMSIYETYTSIGEDLRSIFDGIATISKVRNPGPRPLLRRFFEDNSRIFLLRTIEEHEQFFREATPYNGHISIYSPFSTKDNTLKRLQALDKMLPTTLKVSLKVLPQFWYGLTRLLTKVPNLQSRVSVETASFHQKVVVLGTETICVGSLNWLSATQDSRASYSNTELSIVLQGPKASEIIERFYSRPADEPGY